MTALDYLRRAGLTVESVTDRLRVSPAKRITPEIRQYIITHRAALLAELSSTSETDKPEPPHTDTPEQDQTDSPPRILTAATASPDWLRARDQYIDHLMGCLACHAPTGRYCPASISIRQTYALTHRRHTNSADSSN